MAGEMGQADCRGPEQWGQGEGREGGGKCAFLSTPTPGGRPGLSQEPPHTVLLPTSHEAAGLGRKGEGSVL